MSKQRRILVVVFGAVLALLVFTAAVLPVIVRSRAVAALTEETGRPVRIEKVSINPFTLTVTVRGLAISAKDGGPFISVAGLKASLGLASIYKRALIISGITIDAPSVSFARLEANRYSFNDIIELRKSKPPKPDSKSETRFSVNNILLKQGSIDFDDQAVSGGKKHTVRNLDIAIPFISNIPYMVEKYTDPHISALVNGAPFVFSGRTKPLSRSMETSLHLDLKQLSLPHYVAYSPTPLPAVLAEGTLDVDADITYRIHTDKKPQLHIMGLARLDGIAVNLKNGRPLLRLPRFELKAALLEVLAGRFAFDSVSFDGLELFVSRTARGEWMYSSLLPAPRKGSDPADTGGGRQQGAAGARQSPLVKIAAFAFTGGSVHIDDELPAGGFKGTISRIDADMTGFSTETGTSAGFELSMLLDAGTEFSADGEFSLTPLTATVSSELTGLKLQRGWPYLARFLSAPVKGTVDLSSTLTYAGETGAALRDGMLKVSGLSARYGDNDGFDLSRLEVNGASYSQKDNNAGAAEFRLSGGSITLSREADGSISLLSLLKNRGTAPSPTAAVTKTPAQEQPKAKAVSGAQKPAGELSYRLKRVVIDRLNATFIDKTFEERPRFTLANTKLSLSNLNGPRFTPAALSFSSTFNKGTPLKAVGEITPVPFRYKGSIDVGRLPFLDFEEYFPPGLNVFLLSGTADTSMNVDVSLKDGRPFGSFKGNAGIRSFHAVDSVAEEDLLKWESLQLDDIQGTLEPFSLALRQIALNGVYSRIIIRKDGTLNLQNLIQKDDLKKDGGPPGAVAAVKPEQPLHSVPPPQVSPKPGRQVRVDAVTIQDGTLAFSDYHLPQHFSSTFYNLGGRVSGLSSEEARFADVDLRGNLENHSPLQITGRINPLREDLFVDLKVAFRDIDLSPVTPYSGRFLGYTVEKGKLFLDLKYRIDKKQLDSENRIFIDQFTFGEKVESDKATGLPVKLGLALLKDRKGEIHLDVPVTGRTDDPKFSIWKLVFQVLQNLLVKAVTSPFALLSSMTGGGQDFSSVSFDYGTSRIPAPEQQKLTALASVLLDRPGLKVELKGFVDRDKDTEAYRGELFSRKLKNEKLQTLIKAGELKEGESLETVQVSPGEYDTLLRSVYRKEKFPKPRNAIGMVKDLPPDEMKKLIVANTIVGEQELQTLARERVAAVSTHLVQKGSVPTERVFQKNDNIFAVPGKESTARSRVELNAIAR